MTQVKNHTEAIKRLIEKGYQKVYETKDHYVVVQESDVIQVKVRVLGEEVLVKAKFPQIGNVVQIVITAILFFVAGYFELGFPVNLIIAITVGQVISFAWYYPKIKKLKESVEQALIQ
ncbi:MAG: hypothetical protein GYB31_17030 [Bacteroidetes bacterium]|nr:hypothetical protein [Bacteroidota bacterium]